MEDAKIIEYQGQPEMAQALRDIAILIRENHKKNWTPDRDQKIADWLAPAGLAWEPLVSTPVQAASSLSPDETAAVERIKGLKEWGDYLNAKINPADLPRPALQALAERMKKDWKCGENRAKQDKKDAFKLVNKLLRQQA
jgi:hypothetical protein